MARKTPERYKTGPKKGQFKPKAKRRSTRRSSSRRKTPARKTRRSYRRNPARPDIVQTLMNGTVTASQVLVGKAAARAVPDVLKLPKGGNAGLAVQVATALALGYVSAMFFKKDTAAAILAGGLTAPVETLILAADVPYLSEYLSPEAEAAAVAGYVQPRRPLSGYVTHGGGARVPALWDDGAGEDLSYSMYN